MLRTNVKMYVSIEKFLQKGRRACEQQILKTICYPLRQFNVGSLFSILFHSFVETFVQFDRPIIPILIDVIGINDGFFFMLLFYNPMGFEGNERRKKNVPFFWTEGKYAEVNIYLND